MSSSSSAPKVPLTRETLKRIAKDVRELHGDTLKEHGIYYRHSETNVLEGQAVIFGAPNTPYDGGCYVFRFQFPEDYPHRPPTLTFASKGERLRVNPNLYRNGKVCISILNTWRGPQWTGCQSISSILLAIRTSILGVPEPILNEPGIYRSHSDFDNYHEILRFKNLELAFWKVLKKLASGECNLYRDLQCVIAKHMLKTFPHFLKGVEKYANDDLKEISTMLYSMCAILDGKSFAKDVRDNADTVVNQLRKEFEIDV